MVSPQITNKHNQGVMKIINEQRQVLNVCITVAAVCAITAIVIIVGFICGFIVFAGLGLL